jgi:orotate phosphoribosyltransferase
MTEQKRLKMMKIIEQRCIEFGDFTLASGAKSYYYYDIKNILLDGNVMSLLGDLILDELTKFEPTPKSVGGLESSAIALASAVSLRSYNKHKQTDGVKGFFVRKNAKTHGSQRRIEGNLVPPIVIIDDVITKGGSIMEAMNAINAQGHTVKGVICVIDREDEENQLKKNGINYTSLFTHSDFEKYIRKNVLIGKLVRNLAS